jgi:hypothetical protein
VRPLDSTRIDPRLLFATPTVAKSPIEVFGATAVGVPPPSHAATAGATSITDALGRKELGLLGVMSLLRLRK